MIKAFFAPLLLATMFSTAAQALVLSESTDPATITTGNSVACSNNTTGETDDNTYYRSFGFSNFGITNSFAISQVTFGIEEASAALPLTVNIYSGTSLTTLGTLVSSQSFTVKAQDLTLYTLTTSALVPFSTGGFVVSIFSPDSGAEFYIGSNAAGQTAPSYIMAPDCGITTPTSLTAIGFPNMDIVMSVTGTVSAVPEPGTYAMMGVGGVLAMGFVRRRMNAAC